jgi:hypothetical protein
MSDQPKCLKKGCVNLKARNKWGICAKCYRKQVKRLETGAIRTMLEHLDEERIPRREKTYVHSGWIQAGLQKTDW